MKERLEEVMNGTGTYSTNTKYKKSTPLLSVALSIYLFMHPTTSFLMNSSKISSHYGTTTIPPPLLSFPIVPFNTIFTPRLDILTFLLRELLLGQHPVSSDRDGIFSHTTLGYRRLLEIIMARFLDVTHSLNWHDNARKLMIPQQAPDR